MLTPNMLRVGRSNERSLDGPMKLPGSASDLLKSVQSTYDAWFKVWNATYLPKLMQQPKWWNQEAHISEGDVVLYRKHDGDISSPWVLGVIDQIVKGRDGLARRALVQRKNASEETSRVTDRHVRKLVKIWSIEDMSIEDDLAELHRRIRNSDADGRLTGILEERGSHDTRDGFKGRFMSHVVSTVRNVDSLLVLSAWIWILVPKKKMNSYLEIMIQWIFLQNLQIVVIAKMNRRNQMNTWDIQLPR